jgi:Flp pilus assembly protein TadG
MVETALAFPVLVLTALALVQLALYAHARHVVTAAVQDGAQVAAAEGGTPSDGLDHAEALLRAGLGPSAERVGLAFRETNGGEAVVAEARGSLGLIIPWVADARLPLDARAVVRKEGFRPGGG